MQLKVTNSIFICATVLLVAVAGAAWAADGDDLVQKAWAGDLEGISQLIDAGADVDARDEAGSTALVLAASFRDYEDVVELLISKGADVNAPDGKGHTPLMVAVSVSKKGTELLLSKGADVTPRCEDDASAFLHWAMGHLEGQDRIDVAELLLAKGADINDALGGSGGTTALMIAVRSNDLELAKFLVSRGANLDATRNRDGKTALALAEKEGNAEIVAFLKEEVEGQADSKEGT